MCLGQHQGGLPISHGVVADKQCTCFASKLIWERYPSTPPFYCGVNEIRASLISSASVGATPTPATNFQNLTARPPTRVSGPVFLGSGVLLPVRSHQRVAWRQRTRLGAGNSRRAQAPGAIPAALTNFSLRPWSNISGIRLLIGTMQVGILPAAPIARWCQSSTTVC